MDGRGWRLHLRAVMIGREKRREEKRREEDRRDRRGEKTREEERRGDCEKSLRRG